ncbi:MAG: proline racemase family protein, partial [Notoacmeibacter sp.]
MRFQHRLTIIDGHTAGEPTRLIVSGYPRLKGATLAEKMADMKANHDWVRCVAMNEPRGHRDMFGGVLLEPIDASADVGVFFIDGGQYYNMCGHASLGICAMMVETGRKQTDPSGQTIVRLETPAGLVEGTVVTAPDGSIITVKLIDVPSFAFALDQIIEVSDFGSLRIDIGYGGNFFVIAEAKDLGFASVDPEHTTRMIEAGIALRNAANDQIKVQHPLLPHINRIDIAMLTAGPSGPHADARNVVILGAAQADRSPCGTGTCARMAVLHAKGQLKTGEQFRHESSIRTVFDSVVLSQTKVGAFAAVIPQIACRPFLTGF